MTTEKELREKAEKNLLKLIHNIKSRCGEENDEQARREFRNNTYKTIKEAEDAGYHPLARELRTTYRIH